MTFGHVSSGWNKLSTIGLLPNRGEVLREDRANCEIINIKKIQSKALARWATGWKLINSDEMQKSGKLLGQFGPN